MSYLLNFLIKIFLYLYIYKDVFILNLELFAELKTLWKSNLIDVQDLNVNFKDISKKLKKTLKEFCLSTQWKGTWREFHLRIKKLLNLPFSVRDNKLLKRLFKLQRDDNKIDINAISFHFPGRSNQAILNQLVKFKLICKRNLKNYQ